MNADMRHLGEGRFAWTEGGRMEIDRRALGEECPGLGPGNPDDDAAMALVRARSEALQPDLEVAIELTFRPALGDGVILIRPAPVEGDGAFAGALADAGQRTFIGSLEGLAERG